jgi:hypothetical protein
MTQQHEDEGEDRPDKPDETPADSDLIAMTGGSSAKEGIFHIAFSGHADFPFVTNG